MAIPENIHTVRRTAFWNSEGKGGFLNWNSKGMGDTYNWNSKGIVGVSDLGFPQASQAQKSSFLCVFESPSSGRLCIRGVCDSLCI